MGNVIPATVCGRGPVYLRRYLHASIPRDYAFRHWGSGILEVLMQKSYLLAATVALVLVMQTPLALAQSAPAAGVTPSAAATTTAPAATTTPAASTDTSTPPAGTKKSAAKKPARKKMTRQQEIDHSIDTGTVPARYRSSVPKQYQQYIPFEKQ